MTLVMSFFAGVAIRYVPDLKLGVTAAYLQGD